MNNEYIAKIIMIPNGPLTLGDKYKVENNLPLTENAKKNKDSINTIFPVAIGKKEKGILYIKRNNNTTNTNTLIIFTPLLSIKVDLFYPYSLTQLDILSPSYSMT